MLLDTDTLLALLIFFSSLMECLQEFCFIRCVFRDKEGTDVKKKEHEEEKCKSSESLPSKPLSHLTVASSEAESSELSASHPNVSLGVQPIPRPRVGSACSSSSSRTDDDNNPPVIPGYTENVGLEKIRVEVVQSSIPEKGVLKLEDENKTPEDLAQDIDAALAQVMSGIKSLGLQHGVELENAVMKGSAEFKRTPDLVIDLPVNSAQPPSPKHNIVSEDSPTLTTAEVFANADQCTIKKGTGGPPQAANPTATESTAVKKPATHDSVIQKSMSDDKTAKDELHARLKQTDASLEGATSTSVVPAPRPRQQRQQSSPAGESSSPPSRTSSRSASERISSTSWTTYTTDIDLEMEFVRSIVLPFEAVTALHRHSYSPRSAESTSCSSPSLTVCESDTGGAAKLDANVAALAQSLPERKEVVKPPIKAKPPIMKKPVRTSELTRRLQDVQGSPDHGDVSGSPLN